MYEPGKTDVTHSRTTENATYVYDEQWANTWDEIDAEEQYVTDNSMTYIEEVYAQYDESDFDDSMQRNCVTVVTCKPSPRTRIRPGRMTEFESKGPRPASTAM